MCWGAICAIWNKEWGGTGPFVARILPPAPLLGMAGLHHRNAHWGRSAAPPERGGATSCPQVLLSLGHVAFCACFTSPPCRDSCFISKGYDATSHFETEINDVLDMYQRITGGYGSLAIYE